MSGLALLATVVLLFGFQAETILAQPARVLLIAIPLTIQSYGIFAIAYGLASGAALATVVGVLIEVPVMPSLVAFANRTRSWFPAPAPGRNEEAPRRP